MVKSWGPLLPYSSLKPFMGTRDVPVTNCSSLARISLSKDNTTCGGAGVMDQLEGNEGFGVIGGGGVDVLYVVAQGRDHVVRATDITHDISTL